MTDFNRLTRDFLLGEAKAPSLASYIQSISEVLSAITPRTKTDSLRIESARGNLKEIRRHVRRLEERVSVLEEQVKILAESKG